MVKESNLTTKELVDKALLNMTLNLPIFADLIIKIGVKLVNNPGIRACAWTNGTGIYINQCIIDELRYGNKDRPDNKKVDFTCLMTVHLKVKLNGNFGIWQLTMRSIVCC